MIKINKLLFKKNFKPTLALGADSSGSVCLANDSVIYFIDSIGDLTLIENYDKFKKNIDELIKKTRPEMIVCDKHPEFVSSEYAKELANRFSCKLIKVQHHKAHIASVAVEHGLTDYVGIACDGLGYGEDGNLWGGEVFDVNGKIFKRIGHLEEQPLIGGDSAAIYPEKMLYGILSKFMKEPQFKSLFEGEKINIYSKQLKQNFNVFSTTSTGRILDAASFLLGVCKIRTYEGGPAIELEKFASGQYYKLDPVIINENVKHILNTTELFRYLIENISKDKRKLAATAQMYIAKGLFEIAKKKNKPIVFTGGVAYNQMISGFMKDKGVLMNKDIPPGDGGVCAGQAVIANL